MSLIQNINKRSGILPDLLTFRSYGALDKTIPVIASPYGRSNLFNNENRAGTCSTDVISQEL